MSRLLAAVAVVSFSPCVLHAEQSGIPPETLKRLHGLGHNVMAHSATQAGMEGVQSAAILDSISKIRDFFSDKAQGALPVLEVAGNKGVRLQNGEITPSGKLSWTQEVVAEGIEIIYDREHAKRYRERRGVFKAIESLSDRGESLSGGAWWEIWKEESPDALKNVQRKTILRLVSDLDNALDFRSELTEGEAKNWIKRLTLRGDDVVAVPIAPMLSNRLPSNELQGGDLTNNVILMGY